MPKYADNHCNRVAGRVGQEYGKKKKEKPKKKMTKVAGSASAAHSQIKAGHKLRKMDKKSRPGGLPNDKNMKKLKKGNPKGAYRVIQEKFK